MVELVEITAAGRRRLATRPTSKDARVRRQAVGELLLEARTIVMRDEAEGRPPTRRFSIVDWGMSLATSKPRAHTVWKGCSKDFLPTDFVKVGGRWKRVEKTLNLFGVKT